MLFSVGIVTKTFQGEMKVYSRKIPNPELVRKKIKKHSINYEMYKYIYCYMFLQPEEEKAKLLVLPEYQETVVKTPFLYLTLDIPAAPLYKDELENNIIPQIPLFNLLAKFNGHTEKVR